MAAYYWDYGGTGGNQAANSTTTTASGFYTITVSNVTASTTAYGNQCFNISVPQPRTILVEHPADWKDEDHAGFVRLVNDETNPGWRVTMLIKGGDILIADPDIEIRSMKDFVPLLKHRASADDRAKIDAFFSEHPA